MQTMSVGELKASFSDILERVQKEGKEIVITYGRKHKKIAKIVPYKESKRPRRFGLFQGKTLHMAEDFAIDDEALLQG